MSSTSGTRLRCPVCEEALDADATESDLASHVDGCLRAAPAQSPDETEIDVDGRDGFEEYEWAGQRRVRATSLVEGGLTDAHGFMTIERGDEDEELDVEGDGDEEKVGGAGQYGEQDVIMPGSSAIDNVEEEEEVSQTANSSIDELSKLRAENAALRASLPTCKVCMDSYVRPVVSVSCWHVQCERCWLRSLGAKRLCPQCKAITRPKDLRRIYL